MAKRKPQRRSLFGRVRDFYHKFDRTTVKHVGRGGKISGGTATGMYRGYRIFKTADGGWSVPELDPGSVFDGKGEAQAFIRAWTRRGNKGARMKKNGARRKANSATLIPAKLKRMPNGTFKVYVAPGAMAKINPVNGYVVYPSSTGYDKLSDAKKAAKAESIELGRARVENVDTEKVVARYRYGQLE